MTSEDDFCAHAVASGGAGVVAERLDGVIADANEAACRMLGYPRDDLVGKPYSVLCVPEDRTSQSTLRAALVAGKRASHVGRWRYVRQNGTTLVADVITSRAPDGGDGPRHIVWVLHERLAPAPDDPVPDAAVVGERLESLGMLAGGIAHDFNNVLAVVRGNLEFARDALEEQVPDVRTALADLHAVERAAERATSLVRQLLAFGRMQTRSPESLDLNAVVRDVLPLLRLSVGGEIPVQPHPAPSLPRVVADRTQIEQVLMNLVVNARDAVVEAVSQSEAEGSAEGTVHRITISTTYATLDDAGAGRVGVPRAGEYVCVSVTDTGIGMTEETRARIFEPFFTTKSVDRGTGLGLAAAWGMVRQSGGAIHVETRYGAGSTFAVYLPSITSPAIDGDADRNGDLPSRDPSERARAVRERGPARRTVLLAEDDHAVRRVTARILRGAGYRVLEAGDGAGALELWRAYGSEIDALVADMRMPRLGGESLARIVATEQPGFPVVLMTGGAGGGNGHGERGAGSAAHTEVLAARAGDVPPLEKPFAAASLLDRLAALLPAGDAVR
ncbi:PAS sensor protein (plasmid) [Gemmatirosa kalamazoonensis]|uniref:histidine kinase n=1 Tax=Gemmatirosa kalamazoonensis TaxID=861299 RepID=W0RWA1_9BACT|nr:ATP-binding protein [Gemmatirosa kalamazoonensis]AHG93853.1 PAS sensor protein [Gemmatirosa kalamazoonensis]